MSNWSGSAVANTGIESQYSWADMVTRIEFELTREKGATDTATKAIWLSIANEFIRRKFAGIRASSELTGLTAQNGSLILPSNVVNVKEVYYDGYPVTRSSRAALDADFPGWQTDSVSPNGFSYWFVEGSRLYTAPPVTSGALVTVRAELGVPLIVAAETPGSLWSYLPSGFEYLPAYAVLSELPFDTEHAAQAARYERNRRRVDELIPALFDAINSANLADWTGA